MRVLYLQLKNFYLNLNKLKVPQKKRTKNNDFCSLNSITIMYKYQAMQHAWQHDVSSSHTNICWI